MIKWFQKALAGMLVSAVCLIPVAAADTPSSWAAAEVEAATQVGLVADDLTQDFQAMITRQQFAGLAVSLIENATGEKLPVAAIDTFSDCTDVGVRKAYAVGLVDGTSPGIFSPEDPLTREQLAVMLAGALDEVQSQLKKTLPTRTAVLSQYDDGAQVSSWAAKDLSRMVGSGLIRGTSDTLLSPQDNCTVEQSILLIYRGYQVATTGKLPPAQKSEKDLLALLNSRIGQEADAYVFCDLDQDGAKEMVAAFLTNESQWDIFYANSDGSQCRMILQNDTTDGYDICDLILLPQRSETHIAINFYNLMGKSKSGSIYALRNGTLSALLSDQTITFYAGNTVGQARFISDDYDEYSDPDGLPMARSEKTGYLYYDGNEYKEYGATEITQEDFLAYTGAAQALADLQQEQSGAVSLELTFYRRSNDILHVQCAAQDEEGGITYGYYTYAVQDDAIVESEGMTSGQVAPYFSTLPVTY